MDDHASERKPKEIDRVDSPSTQNQAAGCKESRSAEPGAGANSQPDPARQWVFQHSSMERYIFGWNLTFRMLRRFGIEPTSLPGKSLLFASFLSFFFGIPVLATALTNQWDSAPLTSWGIIAVLFAWFSSNYEAFQAASRENCAIGFTVEDKASLRSQIQWDATWFRLRVAMTGGALTTVLILSSILSIQSNHAPYFIPFGTYIVIGLLAYQIGENTLNNILVCVEIQRFTRMTHHLHRFYPLLTPEIQTSIRGYSRLGFLSSILMTFYIGSSALLLPEQVYLRNWVWLALMVTAYMVIILGILISRLSIQQILQRFKQRILLPIRKQIDGMFDRYQSLSEEEYQELMRLDSIHNKIQSAPDSCLPLYTIGRLFGNLVLPTLTFVLAVMGEVYLSALLERFFH